MITLAFTILLAAALVLQLIALRETGNLLRLGYLLRIPLLCIFILMMFGPIAVGPGASLLWGLLDIEGNLLGLWAVALVAALAGCAAVTQINLVMHYGKERLDDPTIAFLDAKAHPRLVFWSGIAPALLLIGCTAVVTQELGVAAKLAACLGGLAVAAAMVLLAKIAQLWLTDDSVTTPPPPYLVLAPKEASKLANWLKQIYEAPQPGPIRALKNWWNKGAVSWSLAGEGRGFFTQPPKPRRLQSGHTFALSLMLLSLVVYLAIGIGKIQADAVGTEPRVPSLAYVVLALLVASWLLSVLAFFLDRFRFSVLITLILLSLITGLFKRTDHIFRTEDAQITHQLRTPGEVLGRVASRGGTPIVIAAAGGGIQAAAWTMHGLKELDRFIPNFRQRIAAVSSISGGSTGALFFGANYGEASLERAYRDACASGLDEVAWGLVLPDAVRTVLPVLVPQKIDRGWALESAWDRRARGPLLSEWCRRAGEDMPAFLINSTAVEKGQLLSFSTTQFPSDEYRRRLRVEPVMERYDRVFKSNFDIRVATAARMSATFPYVSPAARPEKPDGRMHLVDGGYYDNWGLIGASQWLDDALENMQGAQPKAIAVVVLRSFPPDPETELADWGWLKQFAAPASAFLAVRSFGQWAGANEQLRLLKQKWEAKGVAIELFDLQHPDKIVGCMHPPLSWKLTKAQRGCITTAWNSLARGDKLGQLKAFVDAARPAPAAPPNAVPTRSSRPVPRTGG